MATTNTTSTKKITKVQRNNDIIALLKGEAVKYGTTIQDAIDHLTYTNELLSRKNKPSKGKKLNKDQERNEAYKDDIRSYMRANPNLLVTSNDLMVKLFMAKYPDIVWTNQKIASLLNSMADKYDKDGNLTDDSGELSKTRGKGKNPTTYQMKPEYLNADDEDGDEESVEA